jgi:hypothetical protein
LAQAIISHLEATYRGHAQTTVAYFYFREEHEDVRSFRNALRCAVVQIAENDNAYCEQVAADISRKNDEELWQQFFADRYPRKSDAHLYLVLDGIDEAHESDRKIMVDLFRQITGEELNIHLVLVLP